MTMKLRNRMIALVCLILFLGVGAALFLNTTARKPFAVILFVADNINPSALTAARLFGGGGDARLQIEEFPNTALCRNPANDFSVPEAASASTSIAAGKHVNRDSLCTDPSGAKLPSLLEEATLAGRSTGLITTGEIVGTTAAAYYAKSLDAKNHADLLAQFCAHAPYDFVAGGGAQDFAAGADAQKPVGDAGKTPLKQLGGKDGKGAVTLRSMAELESQPFWKKLPVLAPLSSGPLAPTRFGEGNPDSPSLSDLVRVAIRHLQSNSRGYLLVIDDPMIASAAAANDAETMFARLLALDQAVGTAKRYAGADALIIVTGRENIGGVQLNGYPLLRDKGVAILALNNQGYPSLCWSTGPGYASEKSPPPTKPKKNSPGILTQPAAYPLPSGVGTAGDVLTLGVGQGSENLHGFLDLTDIHRVIKDSL